MAKAVYFNLQLSTATQEKSADTHYLGYKKKKSHKKLQIRKLQDD